MTCYYIRVLNHGLRKFVDADVGARYNGTEIRGGNR